LVLAEVTFTDGSTFKFSADAYSGNPTLFFVRVALLGRRQRSPWKPGSTRSNLLKECPGSGEIDGIDTLDPVRKSYVKGTIGEIVLRSVTLYRISPDDKNLSVLYGNPPLLTDSNSQRGSDNPLGKVLLKEARPINS